MAKNLPGINARIHHVGDSYQAHRTMVLSDGQRKPGAHFGWSADRKRFRMFNRRFPGGMRSFESVPRLRLIWRILRRVPVMP
jgi:hypothetical protein